MKRQEAKADYNQARDLAKTLTVPGPYLLKVEDYANVHPCEGGHFVEATIWVPDPSKGSRPC